MDEEKESNGLRRNSNVIILGLCLIIVMLLIAPPDIKFFLLDESSNLSINNSVNFVNGGFIQGEGNCTRMVSPDTLEIVEVCNNESVHIFTGGIQRININESLAFFGIDTNINGSLTANTFIGDGSGITNITASDLWEITSPQGIIQPKNFEENRTVKVFKLIVEDRNSIVIGGIQNGTSFAEISAETIDFPAVNASIQQVVISESLIAKSNKSLTLLVTNQNQDTSAGALSITSAGDNVGNGMALFKRNSNHEDPFLGQVLSLNGNVDFMTTKSNNGSTFGPNRLNFGFYDDILVVGNQTVNTTVVNKSFVMIMNTSQINLLIETHVEENLYFNQTFSSDTNSSPLNISNMIALFARDNSKLYLRRPDGTERRIVDAGGGSVIFDEVIKILNNTYIYGDLFLNNSISNGNTYACFDKDGKLFSSPFRCT